MRSFLANFLIVLGVFSLLISGFFVWQRINPNRLSFENVDENLLSNAASKRSNRPLYLSIDDLQISTPVIPAQYNEGHWQTTTKGISYLEGSGEPGKLGNSIFYGHNYKNILGNLKNARTGQIIEVRIEGGEVKKFRIEYVQVVDPDQVGVLEQTADKRLTLYTCTGFLDNRRLVVTAFLIET